MKRILQVLCAYIIFVAAAVMTVSFLYRNVPELIDGQELAYRLNRGLLWLMAYLPAAMLSGFLVGTSIAFGKDSENSKRKYSAGMFERYKTVMIIALCMVLVLTVCAEIITPLLQTRREKFENAPQDLRDYIVLSKDCIASGRITLAYQYASMAYSIAPNDSEVARLYENASDSLRIAKASAPSPVPPAYTEAERLTDTKIDGNNTEYTVHLLLARADAEFVNGEYFNAHYFASLASDIAQSTDPNGIRAKQLAADAWNELEKARVFENEEVRRFYARKKEGYRALNNKNYLAAYYIFSALSNESLSYAADPDVKRYLAVAAEKVEENYFFIENIDATIIAQAPKMRPHIDAMREKIANTLHIDVSQVNVKATTEEGLGFTGTGEGISAQAICLLTSPLGVGSEDVTESGQGCAGCSGCPMNK